MAIGKCNLSRVLGVRLPTGCRLTRVSTSVLGKPPTLNRLPCTCLLCNGTLSPIDLTLTLIRVSFPGLIPLRSIRKCRILETPVPPASTNDSCDDLLLRH